MHSPSSKSILRSVVLPLMVATAAACSGGAGDEADSTSQAATATTDLFDTLAQNSNGAHSGHDFATVTHHADQQTVLYSAAYVPQEDVDPHFTKNPLDNPLLQSLVTMIDSAPAGSNIHMAHFQFELPVVTDALIAALKRGVGVRLVKADNGDDSSSEAARLKRAMKAVPTSLGTSDFNDVDACEHKATSTDPGACIGLHLMHNKFVLFSKLCKSGVASDGTCNAGGFYGGVSAQMSVNLQSGNLYCFNTLSVFGGDGVLESAAPSAGFTHLYTTYRDYFDALYGAGKAVPAKYDFRENMANPGSSSSFEGLPLLPAQADDDMIDDLNAITCAKKSGTTVYITSNLWSYAGTGDKTRRDYALMKAVKGLDSRGCKIMVAGAASMNVDSNTFANAEAKADGTKASELWQAAHELKSLAQLDSSQFRFFKVGPDAPGFVTLHAKLIIVEQPAGTPNQLFFGSLTMENAAPLNDQVWLSITDPDANTFDFYKRVFNAVFANLSGKPSEIPNTDPTN